MATYHDFMACEVQKFDETLDLIASTKWLFAVEGAFRTSCCKKKNKVNFASNFLCDSAKMWLDGKICEKKFNDLIRYCPEYYGNEKLKSERFQRMLRDDIREVISPFKCTTLDDLLRHKSNECPNPKVIKVEPLKSIKEEKVEKAKVSNPKARVYVMITEEDKVVHDVVTGTILVNSIPAHVLYDSGASVSFVSHEFSKNLSAPPNKLPFPLEVEIAGSKVVVVSNVS
ncbi:hypothetical protein Tco_1270461 [Tanacetum coccineum]